MNITDLLVLMQRIGKMHEQMLKELCRQYDLSLIETKIIAFLHNNPTKDTAGDIVELRMLSKGNVSQAVDLLCQKGLLSKTADQTDRRKTHLSLLPSCENVTGAIDTFQSAFYHNLFDGFSLEEFQMFASLNERLASNVATIYHKGDY